VIIAIIIKWNVVEFMFIDFLFVSFTFPKYYRFSLYTTIDAKKTTCWHNLVVFKSRAKRSKINLNFSKTDTKETVTAQNSTYTRQDRETHNWQREQLSYLIDVRRAGYVEFSAHNSRLAYGRRWSPADGSSFGKCQNAGGAILISPGSERVVELSRAGRITES